MRIWKFSIILASAALLAGKAEAVPAFAVQTAQVTSFAVPQFTFGGGWYTALYFANTTNLVAHIQVSFYGDAGTPLAVPLVGIGSVASQSIDINPFSTVILEAPDTGGVNQEGWAEVTLPTGVTGYAVFRQTVPGRPDQEAVVPLTPEASLTADLTYDDILFTTGDARQSRIMPRRGAGGSRHEVLPGGGSRRSTCSTASSSASPQSPGTWFPQPARRSTWPPRTSTRRSGRRAS